MAQKTKKIFTKIFTQAETNILGTLGKITVEKSWKKISQVGALEDIFLSLEYPDFESKFEKYGKLTSNYFYVAR